MADSSYTLEFWRPRVARLIAAEFPRVPEAYAMAWMGMESGGNPCAVGEPGQLGQGSNQPAEIGLGQLYNPDDFKKFGQDPAKFRAYAPEAAPLAMRYRQAQAEAKVAHDAGNQQAETIARATMRVIATQIQSRTRQLTDAECDDQVRWTLLAKIADDMKIADREVATYSLAHWSAPDYYKLVKAPHALPVILSRGLPAVVKKLGRAPMSWAEFRTVLGMESSAQWKRALDACETCGNVMQAAVA